MEPRQANAPPAATAREERRAKSAGASYGARALTRRQSVLASAARGMHALSSHVPVPIVHRDLKSLNVRARAARVGARPRLSLSSLSSL